MLLQNKLGQTLLCSQGLQWTWIHIEDILKTDKSNYGRLIAENKKKVYISNFH